ncbi:phage tail tape measure protein [Christensenella tenuis]|uniref:Phage tail tape measure protein n=1 Tax=Christensenella tenuis TaxID=2763033 RepID=A0ABR7EFF8_9FIRM|nr:phage tail tape measure protein [Christensenella tenuis]MBC5648507.1 phage tail tape measure protein [Christensenella tenuis]
MAKKVTRTISTRIAVEGERECQAAVTNLTSEFKKLESALKVAQNQFKNNANSIEALTAKDKALTNIQEAQTRALANAQKGFKNAENAAKEYRATKERLNTEIADNKKKLDELKSSQEDTAEEEERITKAIEELNNELVDNQNRLDAAERGMNKWQVSIDEAQMKLDDTNAEIEKNAQYLDEAKNSANGCAASIDRYGKSTEEAGRQSKEFGDRSKEGIEALSTALAAAGVAATVKEIAEALRECCDASIEFESAMAGVAKTTDLSEAELSQMSDAIKEMSERIPLTTTELAGIAEAGGQLGIAKEDLLSFTETMAMLGTATNVTSDEAATMIAQFANVTGLDPDKYENLGSAIVDLGNNSATTESKIMELSQRFAAAASVAGFSETDILGFAAATSSLGIEAEAGGSALSKLVSNIQLAVETGDGLNEFAAVAGMSADAFAQAWGVDAAGATAQFITGLNNTERNGKSAIAVLDEMGLSEVRLRNAVTSLAKSGDLLTDSISMSSTAFKENTALAKEANTKYSTSESRLQILKNSFNNLKIAVGNQLNPALENLTKIGEGVIDWATEFIETHEGIVPVVTAVVAGLAVMAAGITAITLASTVGAKAVAAFKAALDTATGGATFLITAIMAVVTALATLILSFDDGVESAYELTEASRESVKELDNIKQAYADSSAKTEAAIITSGRYVDMLRELEPQLDNSTEAQTRYKLIVDQLNELFPELNLRIDENTHAIEGGTEALTKNIEEMQAYYRQQAAMEAYNDIMMEMGAIENEISVNKNKAAESEDKLREAREDHQKIVDKYNKRVSELQKIEKETGKVLVDSDAELMQLQKDLENQGDVVAACENQTDEYNKAIQTGQENLAVFTEENKVYIDTLYSAGQVTTEYTDAVAGMTDAYREQYDAIIETGAQVDMLQQQYDDAYNKAYESISGQIGLFQEMDGEADQSVNDLIDSLDNQIAYMDTYASNMQKAMEMGVDQGLIKKLSDGSEQSAKILDAIVKGGAEKVPQLNEKLALVEEGKKTFSNAYAQMETDFDAKMAAIEIRMGEMVSNLDKADDAAKAGSDTAQGFINGAKSKYGEVYNAYAEMARRAMRAVDDTLERKSPAKQMIRRSEDAGEGLVVGAKNKEDDVAEAYAGMAKTAMCSYDSAMEDLKYQYMAASIPMLDMHEIINTRTAEMHSGDINISMPITVKGKMTDAEIRRMTDQMVYTVRKKVGRLMN